MAGAFPIRVVVQRTGLTPRQIRHYERFGLLAPDRSEGGQRLYRTEDIERLLKVKELVARGLSLKAARAWFEDKRDDGPLPERLGPTRLTSLYPVSDRAELERVISERESEEDQS